MNAQSLLFSLVPPSPLECGGRVALSQSSPSVSLTSAALAPPGLSLTSSPCGEAPLLPPHMSSSALRVATCVCPVGLSLSPFAPPPLCSDKAGGEAWHCHALLVWLSASRQSRCCARKMSPFPLLLRPVIERGGADCTSPRPPILPRRPTCSHLSKSVSPNPCPTDTNVRSA